ARPSRRGSSLQSKAPTIPNIRLRAPVRKTIGTGGTKTATAKYSALRAGGTPITITPAPRPWTTMAAGLKCPTTVTYGSPMRATTGPHTETVGGFGTPITAGHGSRTSLGAGRTITTAAG